jgi:hypothetical protein
MTTELQIYNFNDIENISNEGFELHLPEETVNYIALIAEQVGDPTYIRTPIFYKKSKKKTKQPTAEELGNFGPTVFRKIESMDTTSDEFNCEKCMDTIKINLNKITSKNYDKLKITIEDSLLELVKCDDDEEKISKVCEYIFNYATNNKFNAKVYAELYIYLIEKFNVLKDLFMKKFDNYVDMFKNIESGNQTDDYDNFCKLNKINEQRKSLSLFIVQLIKLDVIPASKICEIILNLQDDLMYSVEWNQETHKCEEICENIFIFVSNLTNELIKEESWKTIYTNLVTVQSYDVKDVISMSNKIKFRHMDILDVIKKHKK